MPLVVFSGGCGLLALRQDLPGGESVAGRPVGVPDCLGEEPSPAPGGTVRLAAHAVATRVRQVTGAVCGCVCGVHPYAVGPVLVSVGYLYRSICYSICLRVCWCVVDGFTVAFLLDLGCVRSHPSACKARHRHEHSI